MIRYCARPPFALDRLHLVGGRSDQVLYLLPGPDLAGRTALRLSALEFLDRLANIFPPPRIHRHRYHGAFAPNAHLRPLVTARAHQDNAAAAQMLGSDLRLPVTSAASPPGPPGGLLCWHGSMKCSPSSVPPAKHPSPSSRSAPSGRPRFLLPGRLGRVRRSHPSGD
ncbi:transposase [Gemmatimonadota bacterium]